MTAEPLTAGRRLCHAAAMEDIVIRPYTAADQAPVIDLARQLQAREASIYDRMKPPETIDAWYMDHMLRACADAAGTVFVAVDGDRVVGYAVVLTELSSAGEIDYTYVQVKDLAMDARHRNRGIGSALLKRCEETARAAGARWLRLSMLTANDAMRLYECAGFAAMVTEMEKPLDG